MRAPFMIALLLFKLFGECHFEFLCVSKIPFPEDCLPPCQDLDFLGFFFPSFLNVTMLR